MNLRLELLILTGLLLATQGLVKATASSVTPQADVFQSGQNIDVNVTASQTTDDVYVILDNSSNGNYDVSTDLLISGSIDSAGSSEFLGNFSATNTTSIEEGFYTIYAVQQSNKPSDGEDVTGEASASIEFDNTDPSITNYNAQKVDFYSSNISFVSSEELGFISVERDPALAITNTDSFSRNSSSGAILYWSIINLEEEGTNTFTLQNAGDKAGNDGANGEEDSVILDPIIRDFQLSEGDSFAQVEIISYDQLSSVNTSLGGNVSGYLDLNDFSESYDSDFDRYTYTANINQGEDGTFNATLLEATNSTGHDGAWGQTDERSFQIAPKVEEFYLDVSNQDVTLHLDTNEKLSMIDASYDGTVSSGELDYSNFTESQDAGYYNYTVDIPSGQEGTYNATLNFAEDDSGNRNSTELTDEIVVDSTAPTISEFSVSNPTTNKVNISFNSSEELSTISVDGSGMESFTLTESDFSTGQTEAPFTYYAVYSAENEGDLTVTLNEAKDASGNDGASGTSLNIGVSYPPTIHEFDLFANSQDVDLEVNVSEQLNNLTVDLSRDVSGNLNMSNFTETSPNSYYIYTTDISDGTEGEFEAALQTANDTQGLDGASGESDYLILDSNPPPNPKTTNITDNIITSDNQSSVTVEVNFSSSTETGKLEVRFNNSKGDTLVKNKSVGSTDQLQAFDFNLTNLSDGEVWAEARMFDEADNLNNEGYTANSSAVTKDTEVPDVKDSITGDSFNGGSAASDKITIEFTDLSGLDVSTVQNKDFTVKVDNEERPIRSLNIDNGRVTITLENDLPTGATPNIDVVNIADSFGNEITTIKTLNARDGLSPQIVSAVIDSSKSTDTETYIEINFTEAVGTDGDSVTIDGKTVNFQTDGSNTEKHTVNYGEVLGTGSSPEVTSVTNVADIEGNNAVVANGRVTVNSFKRELSQGKNLVSFPIEDKTTYAVSELLPENKINAVWAYYEGEWKVYSPGASNNDFNQIKGGYGYIVDAKEDFSIAPTVNTSASSEVAEYPVEEGWNLVAQMQEYDQTADAGGAFNSNLNVEEVHKKASSSFDYTRIDPDSSLPEDMSPGNAYWMKSGDGNTIITPNFSVSQSNIVIEMVRGITDIFGNLFGFVAEVIG